MVFREFCEKTLSNDVIVIVNDIMHGKPLHESVAAYRFLLEDGPGKPEWADEVLDKEVVRFSHGKIAKDYPHTHYIVQLEEISGKNTITLYKGYNPDQFFGGYFWSLEEVWDDWKHIYSKPYLVELPENFYVGKTVSGEKAIFQEGNSCGYEVSCFSSRENCNPYLIGGNPTRKIKLKVLKKKD